LLSARALQDEKNNQRYDKKNGNLSSRGAKCRGKSSAGAILVPPVIAATALAVSSIHNDLFER
jgi:hypothetical protein